MQCKWVVLCKRNASGVDPSGSTGGASRVRTEKEDIVGSTEQYAERKEALRAVVALQHEINAAERLRKFRPITFADLIAHYRQRELDTSGS
jgi:hypothetical protein